jgi:hypothetical protein
MVARILIILAMTTGLERIGEMYEHSLFDGGFRPDKI